MTRLIGAILQAVGLLIAGASGLCSAWFTIMMGTSGDFGPLPGLLLLVALFGGIPFAFGLGFFFLGKRIARKTPIDESDTFR
ncbi:MULTISPECIES: hypothetical protein [unclassified Novosphingobium]|uniref:hypothetical protein n=1 Tax=Novosphingobium TaxID=165696 RepID=UPI001446AB29|nr:MULTISPECIES: hypothetical protein [unclassified Novosphingobium]NKJ41386.1 hypothetical protein [Novosphingobium sp. SG720]NMN03634.1 hypothetical protein [Novosphingobium sp. SG919]NMN86376.1 hypothetical protein [Novosphingobium sp. SG916]